MRLLPCGERALLIEVASLDAVLALEAGLRAAAVGWDEVVDIVPAARTVLVSGAPVGRLRPLLEAVLRGEVAPIPTRADREVVVPVRYDGPDLAEVARLTGLTEGDVVALHTGSRWRVAFGGFAPGFAYLVGGDPRLQVPRQSSPRTRVPAGSVGLADGFSGIYPRASPGGWRLIGATDVVLFDETATPPALLSPGTRVRFSATDSPAGSRRGPAPAAVREGTRSLAVESCLLPILVQDEGRPGLAAVGVGDSGAADREAYRLGGRLVGNTGGEAALEITMGQVTLRVDGEALMAATGAVCPIRVNGRAVSAGVAFQVQDGALVSVGAPLDGLRSYLSVRGGIDAEPVLGSRSRDTLGGLGPRPLLPGHRVALGEPTAPWLPSIDWTPLTSEPRDVVELRYLPGPRRDWVTGLNGSTWRVGADVDRVGARLTGVPLGRRPGELQSEPMVRGAIQVPPSGEPVLCLADHPVTGGYPVAGVLTEKAADSAAQLRPGQRCRLVAVGRLS